MENSIVKVEHLSHRYSVQWAIRDIDFEINQRGILGLLGSNGAGKSTTMNIICGVLKQTEGNVYINGINLRENPVEAKKNVGFLPQKAPLHLDFTVDEYLTYCAELHMVDKTRIKAAVDEAKERCGITHFSKRVLRNLSGGYQQRVGIAQAIVHNPKFVVLDEPTNGLDPNQIVEVRHLIKEIAEERSVLLSTHILSEVQATCREIKMIENGQMIFSGTIEQFDNYIQPNTLLLELDTPPMECDLMLPGISKVETLSERRFRLRYDGDQDTAKRVAEQCVTRGWGLIELVIEKSSLDAVFAQLSKNAARGKRK
ncbi:MULTISPECIES: ABC transporter ATP-binding protein [Butyricimonas]|jgi:ABC-2 type transport system ATP-binding protein|uniref:ATP-binding cassette domain-containing protein n=3 Tax=Butyricimonas virosa TaxID=544645 RepID=A0A415QDK5_9BACT|nr:MULTISPECIES: ATP-binding cassette domain-containing protein [Butyricimonas]MBO4957977.1 ATP-binding cassette domain-containing protein [Butyricimonas sp.]MBR5461356.1 ATP-binding cassette domain-containing protein [Butyricimonas sp.]MCI7294817.1 ATP-binding cassette domain-containing protein [Butyricimonas virosa]MCI7391409.1 ATP-binding cassette domain-containing protein [Butyricimonas virosa]MCQ4872812.1 ATP-binding cassette domain-containing protein [Butyricimonas paravirosa]